jgi:hypothetical protein
VPQPCTGDDCGEEGSKWCDAETWGGTLPTVSDHVLLPDGVITIDCEVEIAGLEIEAPATLRASRSRSSRLTLHGNLVVRGTLDYGAPDDRVAEGTAAEIVFTSMNDESYQGTPLGDQPDGLNPIEILDSDVGLWVVDDGVFRAAGQPKRAWSHLVSTIGKGESSFAVEDASGWVEGDRVMLTPTATIAEADHYKQFDELTIAAVAGNEVTVDGGASYQHLGCEGCMRRGEAANLTRNVVVRSADDSAHAHMLIAHRGKLELDSVELRWLGPSRACSGEEPLRRSPITFYQQHGDAEGSFVRHTSIWGGENHFMDVERSHGIAIEDVAGYDAAGEGFMVHYRITCGMGDAGCEVGPHQTQLASTSVLLTDVLAAKLRVHERVNGCLRIDHTMTAFAHVGGEGSGCLGCVATGVGYEGGGDNLSGFRWESKTARPDDFTFEGNVAHNIKGHGAYMWHNGCPPQAAYSDNSFWSLGKMGILWGAYGCRYVHDNLVINDTGQESLGIKAIADDDRDRVSNATIDDMMILAYVLPGKNAHVFSNITFSGDEAVAISQIHEACTNGNDQDINDPTCAVATIRFENPTFDAGVTVPFDFGWTLNKHTSWEVAGFSHPSMPNLPANFVLYRKDNQVPGGCYHAPFDAWMVPCP